MGDVPAEAAGVGCEVAAAAAAAAGKHGGPSAEGKSGVDSDEILRHYQQIYHRRKLVRACPVVTLPPPPHLSASDVWRCDVASVTPVTVGAAVTHATRVCAGTPF